MTKKIGGTGPWQLYDWFDYNMRSGAFGDWRKADRNSGLLPLVYNLIDLALLPLGNRLWRAAKHGQGMRYHADSPSE